jgi:hypothetical protein
MHAAHLQGLVERPAPGVFPTRSSENTALGIGGRRQIGTGARSIIVTNPATISTRRIAQPITRNRPMKRTSIYVASGLAVVLSLAALGIGAAVDTPRTLMSRADYTAARRVIETESSKGYAACRGERGSTRAVCRAQVRASERVKIADLQARYFGTVAAEESAREARVKARFDVARVQCRERGGEAQAECLRAARDDQARALASAKLAST